MKKLLLVLAVAGVFAACNNSGESTPAADTTTVKADTTVVKVDTAAVKADTTIKADTTKKDTAAKK